jgi:hypothetical protein
MTMGRIHPSFVSKKYASKTDRKVAEPARLSHRDVVRSSIRRRVYVSVLPSKMVFMRLDEDRFFGEDGAVEDAAVAVDEVGWAGGFAGVVGEFDGGLAVGGGELADEGDGGERVFTAGVAVAEVVG